MRSSKNFINLVELRHAKHTIYFYNFITFNTDTDGNKLYEKIMVFHEIYNFLVEVFI